jgi:hypothetical protein
VLRPARKRSRADKWAGCPQVRPPQPCIMKPRLTAGNGLCKQAYYWFTRVQGHATLEPWQQQQQQAAPAAGLQWLCRPRMSCGALPVGC